MRTALLAFWMIFLVSCSPNQLEETALTQQERSLARGAVNDVARGDVASFEKKLPSAMRGHAQVAVRQMQAEMPPPPYKLTFSNAQWTASGGTRTAQAFYIVEGKDRWRLADIMMQSSGGQLNLIGFHLGRFPSDPKVATAFSLADAKPAGWMMLVAMAAAFGTTIAALVRIWRSGLFSRRWLWTIGTVIGVASVKLNWTTGEWAFQPLSIQFFSVSALKQPIYMPWVLGASLPVVALIVLIRRKRPVADENRDES